MRGRRLTLLALLILSSTAGVVAAVALANFQRNDRGFFIRAVEAWQESGLLIYADNPDLQIGPAVIWLLALGEPAAGEGFLIGLLIALMLLWPAIGFLALAVARRTGEREIDLADVALVLIGAFTWIDLCVWAHIDDALATLLLLGALAVRGRAIPSGLLVGLAVACKPWAVIGVALTPRARPWHFLAASGATVVAFALPFVLREPGTITSSGGFAGYVFEGSLWRLVGFDVFQRPPGGFRLVELALLALLAWWLGRRLGPAQAMVVALAVRIAVEPGTHSYYVAPLVVMLLASGLPTWRRSIGGAAALALWLGSNTEADLPVSLLRLVACVVIVLAAVEAGGKSSDEGPAARRTVPVSGSG